MSKPEYILTKDQVEFYTPFFERKEWFEDYLALTRRILTQMSHDNPCNYLPLIEGHLRFTEALLDILEHGKAYHKLLYEDGYFYRLREEYEEQKADTLQRINNTLSQTVKKEEE